MRGDDGEKAACLAHGARRRKAERHEKSPHEAGRGNERALTSARSSYCSVLPFDAAEPIQSQVPRCALRGAAGGKPYRQFAYNRAIR